MAVSKSTQTTVIQYKKRIGDGCWVTLTDISGKEQCVVLLNNVLFIKFALFGYILLSKTTIGPSSFH